mgnify:CR=1 FL=1
MLLEAQVACETALKAYAACRPARDQIFVVGSGGDAGSSGELAVPYPLVQHICNLLP